MNGVPLRITLSKEGYIFFVGAGDAIFFPGIAELVPFIGELVIFDAGVMAGVETGAGVLTDMGVFAGLTVTLVLLAESPQAIPNALIPRTAESTITLFI